MHVSNDTSGGAGRAARRVHQGLLKRGIRSSMFVRYGEPDDRSIIGYDVDSSLSATVRRFLRYVWMRSDFFPRYVSWPVGGMPLSDDRSRFAGEVFRQLPSFDILQLHWVAEFIDIPFVLKNVDSPVVWRLPDMYAFTGGCHYTSGCQRFGKACGCCPQLGSSESSDPSRRSWRRKRSAYKQLVDEDRLHIVATSTWLKNKAKKSTLFRDVPVYRIPNSLDIRVFKPKKFKKRKKKIGIKSSSKVILFVAQNSEDERKGLELLKSALYSIEYEEAVLLSVGKKNPTIESNINHVHIGYINNDEKLSELYSMADVFVIPSLQEAFGQTALEAMACGTPVVGFDAGGIPDMVRPGETGWLAETGNVRSLRDAIDAALESDEDRERMGRRCREVVEEEYTLERQAEQYTALYESILSQQ